MIVLVKMMTTVKIDHDPELELSSDAVVMTDSDSHHDQDLHGVVVPVVE